MSDRRETDEQTHLPPQDVDAERAVLGAMLQNPNAVDAVLDLGLGAEDFYRPGHQTIFSVMRDLHGREAVDIVTVTSELRHRNKLDDVGGQVAIADLAAATPSAANVRHYAEVVQNQSMLRGLVTAGTEISRLGYEHPGEPRALLDQAEQMVYELGEQRQKSDIVRAAELLPEIYDELSQRAEKGYTENSVASGFIDLDDIIGGFRPGNLIVIGARPGIGKTAFALNIAEHVALKEQKGVLVFSLEMGPNELGQRMMCSIARVNSERVKKAKLRNEDWPRLLDAVNQMEQARDLLFFDDSSQLTPMELRGKARRLHARNPLSLIVVDYLQLMDAGVRSDSRQQEVAVISRSLKSLARDLEIPIIALSQLSRGVTQRDNKRPVLSDLRESGAIEQDADIVAFLHSEDVVPGTEGAAADPTAELIVAKHRNGRQGTVHLGWLPMYTRFTNLDHASKYSKPEAAQQQPAQPTQPVGAGSLPGRVDSPGAGPGVVFRPL